MVSVKILSAILIFVAGLLLNFSIKRFTNHVIYNDIKPSGLVVQETVNFWGQMKYALYGSYLILLNGESFRVSRLEDYYDTSEEAEEAKENFTTTTLFVNPTNPYKVTKDPNVIWTTMLVVCVLLIGIYSLFKQDLPFLFYYQLVLNIIVIGITVYFYSRDLN